MSDFDKAFLLAMHSEVGPNFDPNDPETQQGLIDTLAQRRKCGYVNNPSDPGGETKFGIAQNANQDVVVRFMTLDQAKDIYNKKYWIGFKCDTMPSLVNILFFDCAVNTGFRRSTKLLQTALGITSDGDFGPGTARSVSSISDPREVCKKFLDAREAFYKNLVAKRPSMNVFLNGWLNRISSLRYWLDNN